MLQIDCKHLNPRDLKQMVEMSSFFLISVTALGPWELGDLERLVYISLADDTICEILEQDSTLLEGLFGWE